MSVFGSPVASGIWVFACRIWESEQYGQRVLSIREIARIDDIALWMNKGCRVVISIAISEGALDVTVPQIELLVLYLNEGGITQRNIKSDGSEMKAMWIGAQVAGGISRTLVVLILYAIRFKTSAFEVKIFQCFFSSKRFRIWKRMPTPIAHRSQRDFVLIHFREGL